MTEETITKFRTDDKSISDDKCTPSDKNHREKKKVIKS